MNRIDVKATIVLAVVAVLAGCLGVTAVAAATLSPVQTIAVGGQSRTFYRRVPTTSSTYYPDTVPSCVGGSGGPGAAALARCDGSTVLRHNLGPAPYRLVFDRVLNGGHAFPGPDPQTQAQYAADGWKNRDALGQPNPYIAEEMWAFFSQFTLAD